ncbi:MAG: hypothetical protein LBV43_03525 [Prevotella sp.]|nr:hypothetical protein [Prevotella sp.]
MKKVRAKKIDLNTCWIYYQPSTISKTRLDLYFGNENTGAPLIYNVENGKFELNINPYGNEKGIPLTNIELAKDYSVLIIETENKAFHFSACYDTDIILFKLFEKLYTGKFPIELLSPDDTEIHIGIVNGQILELSTIPFDKEHKIIPLKGIKIKIQEYNSDGKPDSTENLLRTLPILSDCFVYIRNSEHYRIKNLSIQTDSLITETDEGVFRDIFKGISLIKDVIGDILKTRLPFKSKYD